jgi:hypothetical protein
VAADYTIDTYTRSIRIAYSGAVSVAEMYEGRRQMMADPAFDRSFSHLVDTRGVETIEMNGFTIKQFAQEQVLGGGARRAIVIPRVHDAGLARMFQIYRELAGGAEEIEIFTDIEAARKWLGLPSEERW